MPAPEDRRQLIREAMNRLLAGTPIRSSGALDIVTLAAEAGVKRHALTHQHKDLKAEFYDRVRSQDKTPHSEVALRAKVLDLEKAMGRLREENTLLIAQVEFLRRMNNVLEMENAALDESLRALQAKPGQVTSLFDRGEGL